MSTVYVCRCPVQLDDGERYCRCLDQPDKGSICKDCRSGQHLNQDGVRVTGRMARTVRPLVLGVTR